MRSKRTHTTLPKQAGLAGVPSAYLELAQLQPGSALTHKQHILQVHRGFDILPTQLFKAAQLEAQRQLVHVHDEQHVLYMACARESLSLRTPGKKGLEEHQGSIREQDAQACKMAARLQVNGYYQT